MTRITFYQGSNPQPPRISALEQIANDTLPVIIPNLVCATVLAIPTIGANAVRGYFASQGTPIESEFISSLISAGPAVAQGLFGLTVGAMFCIKPYIGGIKSRVDAPIPGGIISGAAYAYLAYLESGAGFEWGYALGKNIS